MVPCGHLACHACMTRCLALKPECPFCRRALRYELCPPAHAAAAARVLTPAALFSLPDATLPLGGRLAGQCRACRVATNEFAAGLLLRNLGSDLGSLRAQYQQQQQQQAQGNNNNPEGPDGVVAAKKRETMRRKVEVWQLSFQLLTDSLSEHGVAAMEMEW